MNSSPSGSKGKAKLEPPTQNLALEDDDDDDDDDDEDEEEDEGMKSEDEDEEEVGFIASHVPQNHNTSAPKKNRMILKKSTLVSLSRAAPEEFELITLPKKPLKRRDLLLVIKTMLKTTMRI